MSCGDLPFYYLEYIVSTLSVSRKPFILLGQHWHRMMDALSHETSTRPQDFALLQVVETAEEVMEALGFFGA